MRALNQCIIKGCTEDGIYPVVMKFGGWDRDHIEYMTPFEQKVLICQKHQDQISGGSVQAFSIGFAKPQGKWDGEGLTDLL